MCRGCLELTMTDSQFCIEHFIDIGEQECRVNGRQRAPTLQ
jgi:hypothetical protein